MRKEVGKIDKKVVKSRFFRIIPTRRPTINLYERVATPDKFDILNNLESLTNPRIREDKKETHLINDSDKSCINQFSLVMAPFTDFSKDKPSRFCDGKFGVFYAAKELKCAIAETKYHTLKFLQATNETSYCSQHRVLSGNFEGIFLNIKGLILPDIYSADDYSAGQSLGNEVKINNDDGIVYDSVRYRGGTCFVLFKPKLIKSINEIKCLKYTYNGYKIVDEDI